MLDDHIPKRILFGWLPQTRPAHGVKLKWRDKAKQDLKNFSISDSWHHLAQGRCLWKQLIAEGLKNLLDPSKFQYKLFFVRPVKGCFEENEIKKDASV